MKYILYYTDNTLDGTRLGEIAKDRIINTHIYAVAVSQKPVSGFKTNIVVGEQPRTAMSIVMAIMRGLESISDHDYVFFAEHDCLYTSSHYEVPDGNQEKIMFNTNYYRCVDGGYARHNPSKMVLSQCSGNVGLLRAAMKEKLHHFMFHERGCLEPGRVPSSAEVIGMVGEYESEFPSVDIRHSGCFSNQTDLSIDCKSVPFWGSWIELREYVGLTV